MPRSFGISDTEYQALKVAGDQSGMTQNFGNEPRVSLERDHRGWFIGVIPCLIPCISRASTASWLGNAQGVLHGADAEVGHAKFGGRRTHPSGAGGRHWASTSGTSGTFCPLLGPSFVSLPELPGFKVLGVRLVASKKW